MLTSSSHCLPKMHVQLQKACLRSSYCSVVTNTILVAAKRAQRTPQSQEDATFLIDRHHILHDHHLIIHSHPLLLGNTIDLRIDNFILVIYLTLCSIYSSIRYDFLRVIPLQILLDLHPTDNIGIVFSSSTHNSLFISTLQLTKQQTILQTNSTLLIIHSAIEHHGT